MPTNDKDKIIRPGDPGSDIHVPRPNPGRNVGGPGSESRPSPQVRPGSPAPNVTPDRMLEPGGPERPYSGLRDRDLRTGPEGRGQRGEGMKQKARQTADSARQTMGQASQQASDAYRRFDGWVHGQAARRPLGTVFAAFAAGYVVSAGLPRWLTRNLARVGLPLAAAGYVARMLSEGRFDDMDQERHQRGRSQRRPGSDVLVTP